MSNSESSESQSERELFFEALGKSGKKERADFLDGACFNRPDLRRRIEELLASHAEQDSFMEETALDVSVTLPDAADLSEKTGSVIDRFQLLEKLGEGGFGSVWAAEQKEPVRRRVALKIIKLGMDTQQVVARFEAERQALALMEHPNIAKVLDAGATDTGRPYFVMELVKGIAITKYCEQEKLGVNERLDLFIKACQAIQHAHQKGIIHRDIKPSNIMVTLHDGVPVPKVIDFGIAKATQQELTEKTIYTQYSQFIGTPAYMSPEQAEMSGLDIDTRSDIYSLGVLLYELLTGSTPFDSSELMQSGLDEMRKIIREREPVRPSTRLSQTLSERESTAPSTRRPSTLPTDLDWIVMKCLEKDRTRRYDSANGLAADLKRHLNDEPVTACPPTTAYRFQKAFRRNKLVFTAGAAVFAALVIGISVSTWQITVARKAQKETEEARFAEEEKSREAERLRVEADDLRAVTETAKYVSQVRLAAFSLEQGNQHTAQVALLATLPEHRNWEWGYLVNEAWPPEIDPRSWTIRDRPMGISVAEFWRNATVKEIASSELEESRMLNAIAFRNNGREILTSPNDGVIHIWQSEFDGERVIGQSKGLLSAITVSRDDALIATGDTKGNISLFNARNGSARWPKQAPIAKPVDALWISPDHQYIVAAYFAGEIGVLDAESGERHTGFTNHLESVALVQFHPDGKTVSTASQDGTVRHWELETGRELASPKLAPYHGRKGISVQAINPANFDEIATGDFDGEVFLWNRVTGERLTPSISKGKDEIKHLRFSEDGSCLFVVEADKLIRVIDRKTGNNLVTIPSENQFLRLKVSRDNGRILTGSGTGSARVWAPVEINKNPVRTLQNAHDDIVTQASFSPDSRRIVTASYDGIAKVWDTANRELIAEFNGHSNELFYASFSPDKEQAVSVSSRGEFRVWEWESGQGRELYRQEVGTDQFFRSAGVRKGIRDMFLEYVAGFSANPFSAAGSRLVLNDGERMLVRDSSNGKVLFPLEGSRHVGWPEISPSGELVAVMTDAFNGINVWELQTGRHKYELKGHTSKAFWAKFSHDNSRIVTASMDKTAIIWDAKYGTKLVKFDQHKGFITVARFSPDDRRVATASNDYKGMIWNSEDGELISTIKGLEQRISNIEFNPDPSINRVLTTSVDNTVRVWDPKPREAREVLQIRRDSKLIYATWSPDGTMILTCWKDGVVQLHKTIPWDQFANITEANEMADRIKAWRSTQN